MVYIFLDFLNIFQNIFLGILKLKVLTFLIGYTSRLKDDIMVHITGTVHNQDFCGCGAGVVLSIRPVRER